MATLLEIRSLFTTNGDLTRKVEGAVCVKAQVIIVEASPSAPRKAWAEATLANYVSEAAKIQRYVIAANKALAVSAIIGAADAAIQASVDTAIDKLYP